MTLHVNQVDYIKPNSSRLRRRSSYVEGMGEFLEVPVGWQIAAGDEEDRYVCRSHDWECEFLVFANGEIYGTEQHGQSEFDMRGQRRASEPGYHLEWDGKKVRGLGGDVLLTSSN
jgi:hypothetical protein